MQRASFLDSLGLRCTCQWEHCIWRWTSAVSLRKWKRLLDDLCSSENNYNYAADFLSKAIVGQHALPTKRRSLTPTEAWNPKFICKFNPTLNYFSQSRSESFWEENMHKNQYSRWGLCFQKHPATWSLRFKKYFMEAWHINSQADHTESGKLYYLLPSTQWESALSTVLKGYYYYLSRINQQSQKKKKILCYGLYNPIIC